MVSSHSPLASAMFQCTRDESSWLDHAELWYEVEKEKDIPVRDLYIRSLFSGIVCNKNQVELLVNLQNVLKNAILYDNPMPVRHWT